MLPTRELVKKLYSAILKPIETSLLGLSLVKQLELREDRKQLKGSERPGLELELSRSRDVNPKSSR